jgi:hypothetical protein
MFGNYVMQHVLEHGTGDQRQRLTSKIQVLLQELCADYWALPVVAKAMQYGSPAERSAMAQAVAENAGQPCPRSKRFARMFSRVLCEAQEGSGETAVPPLREAGPRRRGCRGRRGNPSNRETCPQRGAHWGSQFAACRS